MPTGQRRWRRWKQSLPHPQQELLGDDKILPFQNNAQGCGEFHQQIQLNSVIQKQAEDDKITHQELFIVLPAVVATKWRGLAVAGGGKYLKHIRFNNILWHQRLPKYARRGTRQQMQLVMLWNIWFYFKHQTLFLFPTLLFANNCIWIQVSYIMSKNGKYHENVVYTFFHTCFCILIFPSLHKSYPLAFKTRLLWLHYIWIDILGTKCQGWKMLDMRYDMDIATN